MNRYTKFILKHRKGIISLFLLLTVVCGAASTLVGVNYSFADYLPEESASTIALDVMEEEYSQPIPNMRVLIKDVSIAEAMDYKKRLEAVDGVEEISWLDDAVDIYAPLEMADTDTIEEWYQDENALYSVTIADGKKESAVADIRKLIGEENAMSGTAVTDALAPYQSEGDIKKVMLFVIPLVFVILFLTTTSWYEPVLFMLTIGIAIVLNMGTNLIFGTISFVTNAAGSVLQLAVSMDYSIFLLHRFEENRRETDSVEEAMIAAVKQSAGSVMSSGLTTVTGFAALILMRFGIGPDMGWVMAKAIVLSLICVLVLLPALAISTYKWIDRTRHRPFYPDFNRLSGVLMKCRIPVLLLLLVITVPCYIAQGKNAFSYGASRVYSSDATQMGRDLQAIDGTFGESNPMVVLVPVGDMEKEVAFNQEINELDFVTSVISYVNTLDQSIPTEFVPSEELSKLYSDHYSRFILTVNTAEGKTGWDEHVETLRQVMRKYYGEEALLAGDLASTADLKTTITQDITRVNLMAIGFVFLILLVTFRSLSLPVILTLVIETAIWLNLAIPYFVSDDLHYIAYLIINSVQLGATIDYAILFTNRYMELRRERAKKEASREAIRLCLLSVFTSSVILTIAGVILGKVSTNLVLSQLGTLVGRGAVLSFVLVFTALPALLLIFDKVIEKTTLGTGFYKEAKKNEP